MELISNIFFYVIPFLIALTTLVFIHEFGHFWVARCVGVKVEVFSIGFGKELFGFNDKHGTRWKFCAIPLGGYIKMFGDKSAVSDSDKDLMSKLSESEKKVAFHSKPLLSRTAVVAAGPLANYLFAILIFSAFFFIYGAPVSTSIISKIASDSPARSVGMMAGDNIVKIDEREIESFSDIQNVMATSLGESISIEIKRDEQIINYEITPQLFIEKDIVGNEIKTYKIGVIADNISRKEVNIFSSIILATKECYRLSMMSLRAIGQIITGKRSSKELSGPIKIAQYSAKSAEQGFRFFLGFVALLSVNLGLMNLLPIPALDGGHLLIYFVEATLGKGIASRVQNFGLQIGVILLIILTIFVTTNDLLGLNLF